MGINSFMKSYGSKFIYNLVPPICYSRHTPFSTAPVYSC